MPSNQLFELQTFELFFIFKSVKFFDKKCTIYLQVASLEKHWNFFIINTFESKNDIVSRYSVRKLFTGLAMAALMALKPIVIKAIPKARTPEKTNTHHGISIL